MELPSIITSADDAPDRSACLPKPTALTPNWDGIHPELKALPQWVNWQYELKPGDKKYSKVPYQPSGYRASSTNPGTWYPFEDCKAAYENGVADGKFDGVGFVTSHDDPYILMDYDHVLPPDAPMHPWARDVVMSAQQENLYVETSISNEGIHIVGRGPQGFKGRKLNAAEVYCHSRFFTITGHSLDLPPAIGTASKSLDLTLQQMGVSLLDLQSDSKIHADPVAVPDSPAIDVASASIDDATIFRLARSAKNADKFTALFDHGDTSGYDDDESRADLALASLIAFWVGPDVPRIESLMRSSKLMRDKWDSHRTYLSITISKALSKTTASDFYDWSKHGAVGTVTNPAIETIITPIRGQSVDDTESEGARSLQLVTSQNGQILPNVNNVIVLLEADPDLKRVLRYNDFADSMEICMAIPDKTGLPDTRRYPRKWEDADTIALQAYIQRNSIPRVARDTVDDALRHYAKDCPYHPVRDYLAGLTWDGRPRIDTWLIEYCNAASDTPAAYLEEVGAKFLISIVARVMRPGCKADHVLVLEGPQGFGKSTALSTLAGDDWFTDSLPSNLDSKDAAIHLRGRLIVEMSELSQFTRSEIETIKAYVSRQVDRYRPPFGVRDIEVPRQCVFAGTTNSEGYLIDTTGNRRFWPVKVGVIDIASLKRDRDQLWAEAHARFKEGEAWHITDSDIIAIQVEQTVSRVVTDPWHADVARILSQHKECDITPGEVLGMISDLKPSDRHKGNAARVSQILRDLGWVKGKRHHSRGQLYLRPTEVQLDLFGGKA